MFDGFIKSRFLTKCKSAIKLTKIRLEGIKRKRNAMQKYLKNDITDLLRNGFDLNAYGRAEGLLIELNKTACYNFIEQFCACISEHLPAMNKQKECPEECREAVPSIMFAAARFADLPELRELRTIFADSYANTLDTNVNQEFVDKLKANPQTKDMKLQLLQDIATESGVEWDPKALEQQLYRPPANEQVWPENSDHIETEITKRIYEQRSARNASPKKMEEENYANVDQTDHQNSDRNTAKVKPDDKKPVSYRFIPPPYTKPKVGESKTSFGSPSDSFGSNKMGNRELNDGDTEENHCPNDSVGEAQQKPISLRRRPLKSPLSKDIISSDAAGKAYSTGIGNENKNPGLKSLGEGNCDEKNGKKNSHSRTVSLPPEEISRTETKRGHNRAFSFQPDNWHVHPKLPDYDDFVAMLTVLRKG